MFGRKKKPQPTKGIRLRNPKYNSPTKKYEKRYTTKQFKKFSPEIQQELTNRYTVILTDYKTRGQKIRSLGRNVSAKNVVKGARRVDSGIMKFNKAMNNVDVAFKEIDRTFAKKKGKSTLDRLAGY